jgi:hypothetical protein
MQQRKVHRIDAAICTQSKENGCWKGFSLQGTFLMHDFVQLDGKDLQVTLQVRPI